MCTHVYPSNTVYPVYPYISCVLMFTLVILYTLDTPIYPVYLYFGVLIGNLGYVGSIFTCEGDRSLI